MNILILATSNNTATPTSLNYHSLMHACQGRITLLSFTFLTLIIPNCLLMAAMRRAINRRWKFIAPMHSYIVSYETARGSVGVPPALEIPQDWGIRGLIEIISAISLHRCVVYYCDRTCARYTDNGDFTVTIRLADVELPTR